MTIFAGDKERNLANTVMDWLLNCRIPGAVSRHLPGRHGAAAQLGHTACRDARGKSRPPDMPARGGRRKLAGSDDFLLARMVCQVGMARKMVQDKARHAPQAAGTGRQIRRMACDGLLGPLHRHGLHDRPGGIQGTPPDDGTPRRWPAPSSGFHSGYCSRPSGSNNPAGCGQTAALHPPRDRPPVPPKEKRQFLVKSENNYYLCEPKGEVQEWLNWPAWKASKPLKGFRGSNPLLSADNLNY